MDFLRSHARSPGDGKPRNKCPAGCRCGWLRVMAGIYFAFSAFVMKSLAAITPDAGIAAMPSINRVIVKTIFLPLFIGTTIIAIASVVWALENWKVEDGLDVGGLDMTCETVRFLWNRLGLMFAKAQRFDVARSRSNGANSPHIQCESRGFQDPLDLVWRHALPRYVIRHRRAKFGFQMFENTNTARIRDRIENLQALLSATHQAIKSHFFEMLGQSRLRQFGGFTQFRHRRFPQGKPAQDNETVLVRHQFEQGCSGFRLFLQLRNLIVVRWFHGSVHMT